MSMATSRGDDLGQAASAELMRLARAVLRALPVALVVGAAITAAVLVTLGNRPEEWEAEAAVTVSTPMSLGRVSLDGGTASSRANAAAVQLDGLRPSLLGFPGAELDAHVAEDTDVVVVRGRAEDPAKATDLVQAALDEYRERARAGQTAEADALLVTLESQRQELVELLPVLPPPPEGEVLATDPLRAAYQRRLETITADIADLQATRDQLGDPLRVLVPPDVPVQVGQSVERRAAVLGLLGFLAVLAAAAGLRQLRNTIEGPTDVRSALGPAVTVREFHTTRSSRGALNSENAGEALAAWYAVLGRDATALLVAVIGSTPGDASPAVAEAMTWAAGRDAGAALLDARGEGAEPLVDRFGADDGHRSEADPSRGQAAIGSSPAQTVQEDSAESWDDWIRTARKAAELVVVLGPDVGNVDALSLAHRADSVILVVARGATSRAVSRAASLLAEAGAPPAVVMLTDRNRWWRRARQRGRS